MEIRSYTHNGADWEWNGDGWEATDFSTDGDFSSYSDLEPILLRGFDSGGKLVAQAEGVVRIGRFHG